MYSVSASNERSRRGMSSFVFSTTLFALWNSVFPGGSPWSSRSYNWRRWLSDVGSISKPGNTNRTVNRVKCRTRTWKSPWWCMERISSCLLNSFSVPTSTKRHRETNNRKKQPVKRSIKAKLRLGKFTEHRFSFSLIYPSDITSHREKEIPLLSALFFWIWTLLIERKQKKRKEGSSHGSGKIFIRLDSSNQPWGSGK